MIGCGITTKSSNSINENAINLRYLKEINVNSNGSNIYR